MKSYPKYKSSGIKWLGEIPEHWDRYRMKFLFNSINGGVWGEEPVGNQNDMICIRVADFDYDNGVINLNKLTTRNISFSEQKGRILKKGDLLIEKSGGGELSPVGRVVKFDLDIKAVCSNFINRLNTKNTCSPDFLNYLNKFLYAKGLTEICINQTIGIQNLKIGEFLGKTVFVPSVDEQQKIVDFLEYKTGQCDRFISNRQKQIELLNEQKATIINKAVTKGINPNAKMKPSGIDWIGDIPEHWEVKKIKRIHQTASGGTPNTTNPNYYGGNIPWLRTLDLNNGKIDQCEIYITDLGLLDSSAKLIPQNSILIAMYGGSGTIGKSGLLNFKAAINQAICAIIPNKKTLPDFLYYFVLFYRPFWMIGASGARKDPNISQDEIKNTDFVFPPLNEQKQIVDFIEKETLKIETLISKYQKQIDLMQEYRTALISQAVTGKIDVREWKPQTK